MRLALVSDIHGNLAALDAVRADIATCAVDAVVDLGDIVSGPLWPAETADLLMSLGWPTIAGDPTGAMRCGPAGRPCRTAGASRDNRGLSTSPIARS